MNILETFKNFSNSRTVRRLFIIIQKNWFHLFAVATYIFFTIFYMGPGFYDCQNSIYGFGDSTAGPIWRESIKPDQPLLGGFERYTNYPTGESLFSPVSYASLIQAATISSLSEVTGPVCAYNIYNIVGYVLSAMVMYGFILFITRNRWIALMSGYAVSFTPYVQSKIGGHPNYSFVGLLVAILWTALHLIKYRKRKSAVLLGVLLATCAYLDPYFILLALTLVVPIVIVWGILNVRSAKTSYVKDGIQWKKILTWMKPFAVTLIAFVMLVAPLVLVRIKYSNVITASVGGVRGNIKEAAMMCSNKPLDYILPDPNNIHLVKIFGQRYTSKNISLRNWCGFGESRVAISISLISVLVVGVVLILWKRIRSGRWRHNIVEKYDAKLVVGSIVGIGVLAFLLGLPPYIYGNIMPGGVLLKITDMWRIFAREYLLVNMAIVMTAALILKYFIGTRFFTKSRIIKTVLFILIFGGIIFEYQINDPFRPPAFNYTRDVPQVYRQIEEDKNVDAIAEYPIDRMGVEYDSTVYYLTMQAVHQKSIINSAAIVNKNENMHIAIKDLSDPQTIPVLRSLGISHVVVHGESACDILDALGKSRVSVAGQSKPIVYGLTMVRADDSNNIVLLKLLDGPKASSVLTINKGYIVKLDLIHSPIATEYEVAQDTELKPLSLKGKTVRATQCFDIKVPGANAPGTLVIKVNGIKQIETNVTNDYSRIAIEASTNDIVSLHNSLGSSMRINNLGCLT